MTATDYVCAELAESSAIALDLLEALDTTGWATEDVRTLEAIVGGFDVRTGRSSPSAQVGRVRRYAHLAPSWMMRSDGHPRP